MPFDLFEETEEEILARRQERQQRESQLAENARELEMFDSPWWRIFAERLRAEEQRAVNQMLGGDPSQMASARERVLFIRHLVSLPERVAKRQAELTSALAELEEEQA